MSRILLVDDNEDLRDVIAWGLRDAGHDVVEAASATEALARVRATREGSALAFTLVVTDVVMPGMSGLELVSALRALGDAPPVLVMSDASYEADALALGVARFVAKPCDFNDLLETIRSMSPRAPAGDANDR